MYCNKCGKKMEETDRFCGSCGNPNPLVLDSKTINAVENGQIKLKIKPIFNIGYQIMINLSWGFVALVLMIVNKNKEVYNSSTIPWILAIILIFMLIKMIFDYLQYQATEYNFYNTKIEYKNGFLNKSEKTLKYKDIREVEKKEGILERIFKLGTIIIYTNASNQNNGIRIHSLENIDEQFEKINQLKNNVQHKK